jgi:hypothetical protein
MRNSLRVVALVILLASYARAQNTQAQSEPAAARESSVSPSACLAEAVSRLDSWCALNGPGCCGVSSRWTVRTDFGDGVGYTRGFTYLEGFVPVYQWSDSDVAFADARVVNFDHWDRWEFNAGGGYRRYLDKFDVVGGMNLFYDGRQTDKNFFHQIGLGAEALFDRWEVRCNGYFIVGPHEQLASDSQSAALVGNELLLDRLRVFEVAMGGVDAEVGVLLPVLPELAPRAFVGFYHYSAEHMQSVNGIRGRIEASLGDHCSIHFAIQHDDVFNTTVSGGLALHFGGPCERCPGGRSPDERLGQRVVRDPDIVIGERAELERARFVVEDDPIILAASSGDTLRPPDTWVPPVSSPGGTPPSGTLPSGTLPPGMPPPTHCLPFPGAPGDPSTFPGNFPPGFHHPCFPGLGHYKFLDLETYDFREDESKKQRHESEKQRHESEKHRDDD